MKNFTVLAIFLLFCISPAHGQTPDSEAPVEDNVCEAQVGAAYGLCTAYCEAMDCDNTDPQAAKTACNMIFNKFVMRTGTVPPCVASCPCWNTNEITTYVDNINENGVSIVCVTKDDYAEIGTNSNKYVLYATVDGYPGGNQDTCIFVDDSQNIERIKFLSSEEEAVVCYSEIANISHLVNCP